MVGEAAYLMEDRKWKMEEVPRKDRALRDMAPLACFLYSSLTPSFHSKSECRGLNHSLKRKKSVY